MRKNKPSSFILLGLFAGVFANPIYAKDEFDLVDEDQYNVHNASRHGRIANIRIFDEQIPPNAHVNGMWSTSFDWPLYAIHSAVLPNKKVITYGPIDNKSGRALNYNIWDPSSGNHSTLGIQTETNVFCSAQNLLGNGKLLITGGDERPNGAGGSGIREANLYDPSLDKMTNGGVMAEDRWYPTLTTMPDGRMLVHGGRINKETAATTPEIYNPNTNTFTQLTGAKSNDVYGIDNKGWYYPRTFINSSGQAVFFKGNNDGIFELDVNANNGKGKLVQKSSTVDGDFRFYYPSVEFKPGKVLTFKADKKTKIVDTNNFSATTVASIPHERIWSDATILADGKVVVTGGATKRQKEENAVKSADIYDPVTNKWTIGASAENSRLYHSSAVLLANGAVLVAGGGPPGPIYHKNAEIYYPPYLFTSSGDWATRPVITSGPTEITHKRKVRINYRHNRSINRVSMLKLGSTTHSYDMGQWFKEVSFTTSNGAVSISPGSRRKNEMRPGYYMVYLIDDLGVPSEAHILKVKL